MQHFGNKSCGKSEQKYLKRMLKFKVGDRLCQYKIEKAISDARKNSLNENKVPKFEKLDDISMER